MSRSRLQSDTCSSTSLCSLITRSNDSLAELDPDDGTLISTSNASLDKSPDLPNVLDAERTFNHVYSLENMIGYGSYAKVFRCVDRVTGVNFAVKIIEDNQLSGYQRRLICNEEGILKKLDHQNIIRLVEVFANEPDIKRMVFEFADQLDVCLALVTDPNFGELSIKDVVQQLFDGLNHLHSEGIIHRDLKLENLLVKSATGSSRKLLKICDFGYAVTLPAGQTFFTLKNTIIGSFEYMSPEIIISQEYSAKLDCWAAGVIVYFLFTGDFPFKGSTVTELARCVVKRQFTLDFASPEWAAASTNAVNFIKGILEPIYTRPTARQLLRHPWFTKPPGDSTNLTTGAPLPIMRQPERLEFLQHEAEMKLKRLYNNSSSDKRLLQVAVPCWSTGIAMRRYRNRFWRGSHEAASANEFLVHSASVGKRRSRSCWTSTRSTSWTGSTGWPSTKDDCGRQANEGATRLSEPNKTWWN